MTLRQTLYSLAAAILTGLAAVSCSSTDAEPQPPVTPELPAEDETTTITFSLSAAPMGASSRAEGDLIDDVYKGEDATQSNELINNWYVAFVREGKVVATANNSLVNPDWNDRVQLELQRGGGYTAIAFANIPAASIPDQFKEGATILPNWKDMICEFATPKPGELIPMCGYLEDFQIQGTVNETFAIEVVRMFSKVQFTFRNLCTSDDITINTISLTPVYNGNIYFFPDYQKKPKPDNEYPDYEPALPAHTADNYISFRHVAGFTVKNEKNNSFSQPESTRFYIKESIAKDNHPTNRFHISLNLKRGYQEPEEVTALADDKLEFFYRNDYVLFPIVISDYTPEIEVFDYPPIGGYPVQVESKGTEFYATFSSSGAFDILARLRDSQGKTVAVQPFDPEANPKQENYVRLVSVAPSIDLTYDPTVGEWQGNFNQGTNQRIVVTFEFKINKLIYTRTLYLLSNKGN